MGFIKAHGWQIGAAIVGIFVISKVAANNAANAAADQYTPAVLQSPNPAPLQQSVPQQISTPSNIGSDLASLIKGQVDSAVLAAGTAKQAVGSTTNVDLINSFLTKVGIGGLQGKQIDLAYNEMGQVTKFDFTNKLPELTVSQQATETASANTTLQNAVTNSISRGFTGIGTVLNAGKQATLLGQQQNQITAASAATKGAIMPRTTKDAPVVIDLKPLGTGNV